MNSAEFHELNGTKIVLFSLDQKADVKLKFDDQRGFKITTSLTSIFKDPSLVPVLFSENGKDLFSEDEENIGDYLQIDSNSLILISVPIDGDVSVGMADFRYLQKEKKLPGVYLLPIDHSLDEVLQLLNTHQRILKEMDIILFKQLSGLMGVY